MGKGRFEAFSDGVLAIIITIMVLELKVPHGDTLAALADLWPVFVSYVISFIYVGIYWNTTTCCMPPPASRCCRSPPAGWARTISGQCPRLSTAGY